MTDSKKRWAVIFHSSTVGVPNRMVDRFASQVEAATEAARLNLTTGFGGHYGAHAVDRLGYEFRKELGLAHARKAERITQMSARTSPGQLDRDIEATVGKKIDRKKLGELMGPWGSDFSYGEGSGAVGAVGSYYYSDKKYPDQTRVERALKAIEGDVPRAERGEHGWTKADAKDLRRIAQGLRYYLLHDYKGGSIAHSTINRDPELYPTTEARRHVQTIQRREDFPEILSISMRADGTNYNVKVPDPKNKLGYDLVDVLIHDNGMRSIKSASRSRTTPDRASKIVARYLAATQGASGRAHSTIASAEGPSPAAPRRLTCDQTTNCPNVVTHIDEKGFVYCTPHGIQRRGSHRCRKLRPSEIKKLERREPIAY